MTDKTKDPVALALENVIEEVCVQLRDKSRDEYGPSWYPGTVYASDLADRLETALRAIKGQANPLSEPCEHSDFGHCLDCTTKKACDSVHAKDQQAQPTIYEGNCKFPDGYCTDPNGVICAPLGKHGDFSFGYDIGYADGLQSIKTSVEAIRKSALKPVEQAQPVEQEKRIAELEDQVQFYKSLCKAEAKAFVNEVKVQLGIAPVDQQAHGAMPASSIDYQQQRGVHADIVIEAINAYDQFMLDDDYDSQGALDRIIGRMRERNELYAAPQPSPIESKEVVEAKRHIENLRELTDLHSWAYTAINEAADFIEDLCRCAPASNTGKERGNAHPEN